MDNSATGREDIVQIKYNIKNTSNEPKNVGVRIMMDTMLGSNDSAPFRVLGENILTEKEYTDYNIPQVWHVFDSLSDPGVIAQGTLFKTSSNKPDKVQFTNWGRAYDQSWNYIANTDYSIGDSAVSIVWNETALQAGEEREYTTYYGMSSYDTNMMPPLTLSVFADEKIEKLGGEFSFVNVSTFIENIGDADAENVTLSLDVPDELEIVDSGQGIPLNRLVFNNIKPYEQKNNVFQLRVKDEYYNTRDKEVELKINLEYTNPLTRVVEKKQMTKTITIINTPLKIVCSTGFKDIKFNGPLDGIYNYDTDSDGLLDMDEVNLECGLIHFNVDGSIILPTLGECIQHKSTLTYVKEGLDRIENTIYISSLGWSIFDTLILPITSDPTNPDSDGDGLYDGNEVKSNRLKYSSTIIDEALIDDSKCFEMNYEAKTEQINTQDKLERKAISKGDFNDNNSIIYKNYLQYRRYLATNSKSVFKIENVQKDSDYVISVPYGANLTVECEVYYSGYKLSPKKVECYKIESDYNQKHYYFIIDSEYKLNDRNANNIRITIGNKGATGSYTINMEQDNWVYAPFGGYCNQLTYYDEYQFKHIDDNALEMYFSYDLITEIERLYQLKVYNSIDYVNRQPIITFPLSYDRAGNIANAMESILFNFKKNSEQLDKFMEYTGTGSTILGIMCLFIPGVRGAKLLEGACTAIGIVSTGYSLLSKKAYDKAKIIKVLMDNNCKIVYKKSSGAISKHQWNGWTSFYYMNKYPINIKGRWNNVVLFDHMHYYDLHSKKFVESLPDFN